MISSSDQAIERKKEMVLGGNVTLEELNEIIFRAIHSPNIEKQVKNIVAFTKGSLGYYIEDEHSFASKITRRLQVLVQEGKVERVPRSTRYRLRV